MLPPSYTKLFFYQSFLRKGSLSFLGSCRTCNPPASVSQVTGITNLPSSLSLFPLHSLSPSISFPSIPPSFTFPLSHSAGAIIQCLVHLGTCAHLNLCTISELPCCVGYCVVSLLGPGVHQVPLSSGRGARACSFVPATSLWWICTLGFFFIVGIYSGVLLYCGYVLWGSFFFF